MRSRRTWCLTAATAAALLLAAVVAAILSPRAGAAGEEKVELRITGGHDTDPRDRGRPVALVAGALGVSPEVFRSAFSGVRPAPEGTQPDPEQVRQNKAVLLGALARYGVTNDELDLVSNFYRYRPGRGELWPLEAAAGYAVVKDGAVTSVVMTRPGYGYNAPPTVSVPGHPDVALDAELHFDRDLKKNGSVASVTPARARGEGRFESGRLLPPEALGELNLTAEQQAEVGRLEWEVRERLDEIFTDGQKQRLLASQDVRLRRTSWEANQRYPGKLKVPG
jgi:hypothetical protein